MNRYIKTASHVNENYKKRIQFSGFEIDKRKPGGVPLRKEFDQHLASSCAATQAGRGAACSFRRSSVSARGLKGAIGNGARSEITPVGGGAAL
jgi:hypothetical protein